MYRSASRFALSAVASSQAPVEASRAAVENAKINLDYATIRAQIDGRTGRQLERQGTLVEPGADPLVVINTLHPVLVRFPVSQRDFPAIQRRLAKGPITVRVSTADSSRVPEAGSISFLDNSVDSLTGTVTAKARFQNPTNILWPGEYLRVSAELEVQANAVAVPTRAVLPGQEGSYVYVIGDDKTAKVRPVKPGREVGEMTTIQDGLKPGEQVVVDGQSRLTPNAKVDAKAAATGASVTPATTQAGTGR